MRVVLFALVTALLPCACGPLDPAKTIDEIRNPDSTACAGAPPQGTTDCRLEGFLRPVPGADIDYEVVPFTLAEDEYYENCDLPSTPTRAIVLTSLEDYEALEATRPCPVESQGNADFIGRYLLDEPLNNDEYAVLAGVNMNGGSTLLTRGLHRVGQSDAAALLLVESAPFGSTVCGPAPVLCGRQDILLLRVQGAAPSEISVFINAADANCPVGEATRDEVSAEVGGCSGGRWILGDDDDAP